MSDGRDRRVHDRIDVDIRVELRDIDVEMTTALIENISRGGVFVRTDKALPVGSQIKLEFCLDDTDKPLQIEGLVKWCSKPLWETEQDGLTGLGVEFTDTDQDTLKTIHAYIDKLAKE